MFIAITKENLFLLLLTFRCIDKLKRHVISILDNLVVYSEIAKL